MGSFDRMFIRIPVFAWSFSITSTFVQHLTMTGVVILRMYLALEGYIK